jgi:membrane protease YdiL (CAAX protease family)
LATAASDVADHQARFDHEVLMSDRDTGANRSSGADTGTSPTVSGNWVARHDLLLYFILAYAVSWAIWPLVLVNPGSSPLVPFGPLIAAVIVALLAGGLRELRALLGQLLRWRVHPIWYVIALLGPFVLAAGAAALTVATGAPAPNLEGHPDWLGIGAALLSTIIIVGLFEEVGWRGFALPRLQRRLDALWAALVLGVIWAPWHLPELISDPGAAASAPIFRMDSGPIRDSGLALQQHQRQPAYRDHLPWRRQYGGQVRVARVLWRELPGRVVVHGWALRCDRGDRDASRRR